jgi:hypothetical protein
MHVLHWRKYPWTEKLEELATILKGRMHTRVYNAEVLAVPEIFWSDVHLRDCLDFRVREERVLLSAERGKCFKTPRFPGREILVSIPATTRIDHRQEQEHF